MEWSGQQNQVPQPAVRPAIGSAPPTAFYGNNPLQGAIDSQGQPSAIGSVSQTGGSSVGQPPAQPGAYAMPSASGVPVPQMPATMPVDDNSVAVDDMQWVNHAKRAIASTHGDPHRQVQLIQHLRSQYLRQRFGRMVHTDEA